MNPFEVFEDRLTDLCIITKCSWTVENMNTDQFGDTVMIRCTHLAAPFNSFKYMNSEGDIADEYGNPAGNIRDYHRDQIRQTGKELGNSVRSERETQSTYAAS